MLASDLLVEIRDHTLRRVAQIPTRDLDLKATIRDSAPGEWTLRLPAEFEGVGHLLKPGAGIIVTGPGDEPLFSGPVDLPKIEADLADPVGIATFTGTTDDALLWRRLAYPSPQVADVGAQTSAYDVRTGAAEDVLTGYVEANVGALAPTSRRIALLAPSVSRGRGPRVTKSARFDVLGTLLQEVATVAGLRFRVVQRGDALVFEVSETRDRRAFVRFDLHNGTLSSTSVARAQPGITRAIVAGQGEGEARTLIERTTAEAEMAEAAWGPWGRIETFIDQRNTDDPTELAQAGDKALFEAAGTTSALAVPSDDLTMRFGVDWSVGDAVTVVVDGEETETVVSSVSFEATVSAVRVGAIFGGAVEPKPGAAIERRVEAVEGRLSSLERNATGGATAALVASTLRLTATEDASTTSTGHALQIGPTSGLNLAIDNNEIVGRNNGAESYVYLSLPRTTSAQGTTADALTRRDYVDSMLPRYRRIDFAALSGVGTSGIRMSETSLPVPTPGRPHLVTLTANANISITTSGAKPSIIGIIADASGETLTRYEAVENSTAGGVGRQVTISTLLPASATSFRVYTTLLNRNTAGTVAISGSTNTDYMTVRIEPAEEF